MKCDICGHPNHTTIACIEQAKKVQSTLTKEQTEQAAKALGWNHFRAVSKDFDYWTSPSGKKYMGWRMPIDLEAIIYKLQTELAKVGLAIGPLVSSRHERLDVLDEQIDQETCEHCSGLGVKNGRVKP